MGVFWGLNTFLHSLRNFLVQAITIILIVCFTAVPQANAEDSPDVPISSLDDLTINFCSYRLVMTAYENEDFTGRTVELAIPNSNNPSCPSGDTVSWRNLDVPPPCWREDWLGGCAVDANDKISSILFRGGKIQAWQDNDFRGARWEWVYPEGTSGWYGVSLGGHPANNQITHISWSRN